MDVERMHFKLPTLVQMFLSFSLENFEKKLCVGCFDCVLIFFSSHFSSWWMMVS